MLWKHSVTILLGVLDIGRVRGAIPAIGRQAQPPSRRGGCEADETDGADGGSD